MINNYHTSSGLGFTGALTLLFIALKLLNKIAWSWWWVLSPIWISAILLIIIFVIIVIVMVISK